MHSVQYLLSCHALCVVQYLFKNDARSFYEMQTQLYFFGAVAGWTLYSIEIYSRDNQKPLIQGKLLSLLLSLSLSV